MKYTTIITIASIFFPVYLFASGPEKYDHMQIYKNQKVTKSGPSHEIAYDNDGKQIARATYKYNKQGQLIESLYSKENKSDGRSEYTYKKSVLKEETLYSAKDSVIEKVVYSYNKLNNMRMYSVKDGLGKEVLRWSFKYSRKKLTGGKRVINKQLTEKFTVRYHKNGKVVRDIFSSTGEKMGTILAHWSGNKLTNRTKDDTTGVYKIDYRYNNKQQLVEMIFFNTVKGKLELAKTHKFSYNEVEKLSKDSDVDKDKKISTLAHE